MASRRLVGRSIDRVAPRALANIKPIVDLAGAQYGKAARRLSFTGFPLHAGSYFDIVPTGVFQDRLKAFWATYLAPLLFCLNAVVCIAGECES